MALYTKSNVSRSKGGTAMIIIFLLGVAFMMGIPLVYMVIQSLKPLDELFVFPPRFSFAGRRCPTIHNFRQ